MPSFKGQKIESDSRRQFIKNMIIAGSLFPFVKGFSFPEKTVVDEKPLEIHIFSKHLQFLNYREMAEAAAGIGFDGVDLTVRPKGHVLPERVTENLPRAVEAIHQAGLKTSMMTTGMADAGNSTGRKVLEMASDLGISYYRMDYFRYLQGENIPESIRHFQEKAKELSELNKKLNIVGCYQNHAGNYMGASIWELWQLLKTADPDFLGVQYDIRHAVVDGGLSWKNGFRLIQPRIKTIVIKDFKWRKKEGRWRVVDMPFGEGMVDFKTYFRMLKEYRIQVPVSLHFEYSLGGAEHGATDLKVDQEMVFRAMRRDLQKVRQIWKDV